MKEPDELALRFLLAFQPPAEPETEYERERLIARAYEWAERFRERIEARDEKQRRDLEESRKAALR